MGVYRQRDLNSKIKTNTSGDINSTYLSMVPWLTGEIGIILQVLMAYFGTSVEACYRLELDETFSKVERNYWLGLNRNRNLVRA